MLPPDNTSAAPEAATPAPSFERDVKPLFRDSDRKAMLFRFDLFLYEDVKANADDIYEQVDGGTMPCDAPWDDGKIATFKSWQDGGYQP